MEIIQNNQQTKTCNKCNTEKQLIEFGNLKNGKFGKRAECKSCRSIEYNKNKENILSKNKVYRDKNKEEISERRKASRTERKEELSVKKREYYQKNKTRMLEVNRLSRLKNKEKIAEYDKLRYKRDKEKIQTRQKSWDKTEKGIICKKRNKANRRLREGDKISSKDTQLFLKQSNNKCYWCDTVINTKNSKSYHLDHYIPLAKGGENSIQNIVLSCPSCNLSKGAKDPIEFANSIGKLL